MVAGGSTYSQLAVSHWSGWACGIKEREQTLECWGAHGGSVVAFRQCLHSFQLAHALAQPLRECKRLPMCCRQPISS